MKVRLRTSWWAVVWLALFGVAVEAQYRFDVWTTEQGLPQNSVYAILQTRDGYLWFTTLDGLVRFDGAQFTVFAKGATPGLASNRFNRLLEDAAGDLWAASEDGGLARYRQGAFTSFTTRDGLPDNFLRGLYDDHEQGLLLATDKGLGHWRAGRFIALSPAATLAGFDGFSYLGRSGALWARGAAGLQRYEQGRLTTWPLRDGTAGEAFNVRYESRDGSLWSGTLHAGLQRWQAGRLTTYGARDGAPPNPVRAFHEDRAGNLWLGTFNSELYRFSAGQFSVAQSFAGVPITVISEDREGNLWLGTELHGLYRLRPQVVTVYGRQQGLAEDNVYPIYEDRAGTLWLGAGGLSKFKDGKWSVEPLPRGSTASGVSALCEDRAGRLWVGGINRLRWWQAGRWTDVTDEFGCGDKKIYAIQQDHAGALWFGTQQGVLKYADGALTRYTTRDGLAGDDVKEIFEDRVGRLWFATYGGLSRWEAGRFVSFTEADGLASNRLRTLHEDADGVLWVGTYDGGLTRLKDGRFTRITTRDGLFNNGVFRILEDARGNFWLSCNRGIYRVSRQQLNAFADGQLQFITSVSYGPADGLLNTECNGGQQPAGWRAHDGRLWFPTQGGAAVIDPQRVLFNPQAPPVVIEHGLLDRAEVDVRRPLTIAPGQENLELHYTGLSFIKSEHVRFKYQLAGLDQSWVEAGTRRIAYYNHLPPGSYTFKVIAANSDGVWNETGARLPITVVPPFWRTWWFFSLLGLGLAGLVVYGYERRVRAAQRAQAAQQAFARQLLESQEAERKRIAAELHDSLGQNLLIIKNYALLGLEPEPDTDADPRAQLADISTLTSQALEEVRAIAYNLRPNQLERIGLSKSIEFMLRQIEASAGLRIAAEIAPLAGLFTPEQEINLYRIVQESINNIIKHAAATTARVSIERAERQVRVRIADDGRGFAPADTMGVETRPSFGLSGIAERARILGGKLTINSAPGQGTTVEVVIILADKPA